MPELTLDALREHGPKVGPERSVEEALDSMASCVMGWQWQSSRIRSRDRDGYLLEFPGPRPESFPELDASKIQMRQCKRFAGETAYFSFYDDGRLEVSREKGLAPFWSGKWATLLGGAQFDFEFRFRISDAELFCRHFSRASPEDVTSEDIVARWTNHESDTNFLGWTQWYSVSLDGDELELSDYQFNFYGDSMVVGVARTQYADRTGDQSWVPASLAEAAYEISFRATSCPKPEDIGLELISMYHRAY